MWSPASYLPAETIAKHPWIIHGYRSVFGDFLPLRKRQMKPKPVQEQKELQSFRERKFGAGYPIFWSRSQYYLGNNRLIPTEEYCDRPSSQYDCIYGCEHTKSCDSLFVFTPEQMKQIVEFAKDDPEAPTFASLKAKLGNVKELADEETVQKEEKREQLNYRERKNAFLKKYGHVYWTQSAPGLFCDRKEPLVHNFCLTGRPSSQYSCFFGCHHTRSCPAFYVFSSERMKFLIECEAEFGRKSTTFSIMKSKLETVEELAVKEQSSEHRDYSPDYELLAEFDQAAVFPVPDFDMPPTATECFSATVNYFGRSKSCPILAPFPEKVAISSKNRSQTPYQQKDLDYYLDNIWCFDSVSVVASCESVHTMQELDPEKWQLLEYSARPFALLDDFTPFMDTRNYIANGNVIANGNEGRRCSADFFDSTVLSAHTPESCPTRSAVTGNCPTGREREGSWGTSTYEDSHSNLSFYDNAQLPELPPIKSYEDLSVPSSMFSSAILVSPLEAREEVRKLALQVNNVDDFIELIPEDLLDYFFSDYRMLVRQKMLEEQCENIRKELMKQPKADEDDSK
ncbi:hypothetical protein ACQ4LE_008113 [Meloidogyne hapla]